MGKYRSKLKRHSKGKNWGTGQSSTANPEYNKHRALATSKFFKANLNSDPKNSNLTVDSVRKHEAMQIYESEKKKDCIMNEISQSLKSYSINSDDVDNNYFDNEDYKTETTKTQKTNFSFASDFTGCTSEAFVKFLKRYEPTHRHHNEMIAILAGIKATLIANGGKETVTEYFLALLEINEDTVKNTGKNIEPQMVLFNYALRSVPKAVLRTKFSSAMKILSDILDNYTENAYHFAIENVIRCMAILLAAQDIQTWSMSSTQKLFDTLLLFCLHTNPNIRKTAQQSIGSIINGHTKATIDNSENDDAVITDTKNQPFHPASNRLRLFCKQQFKAENIANSQSVIHYTLNTIKNTFQRLDGADIKYIAEQILSIMTTANVILRMHCFSVIQSLFQSKPPTLSGIVCAKLITALYEFRPDKNDVEPTITWLETLRDGFICLFAYDLNLCIQSIPTFLEICVVELWYTMFEKITDKTTIIIKDIFLNCIKLACCGENERCLPMYNSSISKSIRLITNGLALTQLDAFLEKVIVTFSYVFEATGKHFLNDLCKPLNMIGTRYEVSSANRLVIENTIQTAIKYVGADIVLKAIPISNNASKFILERSWLLPLLRMSITESTLEYFRLNILNFAEKCLVQSREYKAVANLTSERTYELIYWQLWGLFPGFCRKPTDIHNFCKIAKMLGEALIERPGIREPIIDGFLELIKSIPTNDDIKVELSKYAKNFLPRFFNIYLADVKQTHEKILRNSVLTLITEYIKLAPIDVREELFQTGKSNLDSSKSNSTNESIINIMIILTLYQSASEIKEFYDQYVTAILQKCIPKNVAVPKDVEQLKQQMRAYRFIESTLNSTEPGCIEFVNNNVIYIKKFLIKTLKGSFKMNQAARLRCLKALILKKTYVTIADNLISKSIFEAVAGYNKAFEDNGNVAFEILLHISQLYNNEDKLNEFIDLIVKGLAEDSEIIKSNTIIVLKEIINHYTGNITIKTLSYLLEQICAILVGKNRKECESSLRFIITFVKVLPLPFVANKLEIILKSISSMVIDAKRYCRRYIGFLLQKLCRKYQSSTIAAFIPGDDEILHKRIKNIQKELSKVKDKKYNKQLMDTMKNVGDETMGEMKNISYTINDILRDSDSEPDSNRNDDDANDDDADDENEAYKYKEKRFKKRKTYLKEQPDENILDFTDINSIANITTTKPGGAKNPMIDDQKKTKTKDPNRGFKVSEDGRLIITEPKRKNGKSLASDDDDENELLDVNAKTMKVTTFKRKLQSSDNYDDDDMEIDEKLSFTKKMRNSIDGQSIKSKKYVNGGIGIHRKLSGSGADGRAMSATGSARSGVSVKSSNTNHFGNKHNCKKTEGDVTMKGLVNPYTYIALKKQMMNKRKKCKNVGMLKNIIKSAQKGAKIGMKKKYN